MITIEHLSKYYGTLHVLKDINLNIEKGEVVSIIGPSGTGKSTLLRCINQLETPSAGNIIINGKNIMDKRTNIAAVRQKMGMVFQNFNLFEHFSVIDNIMVGPMKLLGWDHDKAEAQAHKLLQDVAMSAKAEAFPSELSGGQKQRVAIARCLSMHPEVMLFDEPTSALDPTMVGEVLNVIRGLAEQGMTMMIVTHEMEFARNVSTRICYVDEGIVYESGTPEEIFTNPQRERTKQFIYHTSNFNYHIVGADYDSYELETKLELFCQRHRINRSSSDNLQHAVEETLQMCFLNDKNVVRENGGIEITIEYSEKTGQLCAVMDGPSQLGTFLTEMSADNYDMMILKGVTSDIKEQVENNRLMLRLTVK
jgi:polar amino acid transport system ATP-binding protein